MIIAGKEFKYGQRVEEMKKKMNQFIQTYDNVISESFSKQLISMFEENPEHMKRLFWKDIVHLHKSHYKTIQSGNHSA